MHNFLFQLYYKDRFKTLKVFLVETKAVLRNKRFQNRNTVKEGRSMNFDRYFLSWRLLFIKLKSSLSRIDKKINHGRYHNHLRNPGNDKDKKGMSHY